MLTLTNVDLHYGAAHALRGVSVGARIGAITTVLGRNGVGKSSLLRAICGHQPISGGDIAWTGESIVGLKAHERTRRGIAYVPQGREIFPLLSVRENLETGYAALARADRTVPDYIFELFPVLKSMLRRRGGDLSGGQQQQLAIARALVTRPRLLVLDEPTEGIQPSVIDEIGDVLQKLKATMSILVVEQYLEFVLGIADWCYVLEKGEVVMSGTPTGLDQEKLKATMSL